jgi:hypothetical protein
MRPDIATGVKPGDTVYNCFMEPLVVVEKTVVIQDRTTNFKVRDYRNHAHNYACEDLYLADLEDEDDAEKAWINWAKDNKDFLITFDHIETTKEIFKAGFGNGFDYKNKYSYMEMMQK